MNQEEYLDQLLEARRSGHPQPPLNDDELAACLAAAEMFIRLQEIEVPADLARRLEVSLRAHANARLRSPDGQILLNEKVLPIAQQHHAANAYRTPQRRAWAAMLGIAAMLILAFAGLLAFSAHIPPGGSLSGQKPPGTQVTSTVGTTDPQSLVNTDILLLRSALTDLHTAVANQSSDETMKLDLQTVSTRSRNCQKAVAAVPAGAERDTAQQNLNAALTEEEQTIRQLLAPVDWPTRLLFTQQLGVLGDPIPTITHVSVHLQSNGMYLITLTGTHFASQARLMLNGQPVGTVSKALNDQLVATIPGTQGYPGQHAFGVLNPDGTAAQFVHTDGDDHNSSGTATPTPDH